MRFRRPTPRLRSIDDVRTRTCPGMPIADIAGLTALNGLAAQLTALSVIVLAFVLLWRVTPLGGVVVVWAAAWVGALVAIAAMFTRYLLLPGLDQQALGSS